MNNNNKVSTHIGAASILLIFMVLSLVSFASLTLVNSRADYILSKKLYDKSSSYYSACHEGNAFVAEANKKLEDLYKNSTNEAQYKKKALGLSLTKSIYISDTQSLEIEIEPAIPSNKNKFYNIVRWQIVTDMNAVTLDESLPVMK